MRNQILLALEELSSFTLEALVQNIKVGYNIRRIGEKVAITFSYQFLNFPEMEKNKERNVNKNMAKKEKTNKLEITITIEGKEWQDALDKAFKQKVKTVAVDGFRKGKCPRDIYEKKFGKESLYIDGAESLLQNAYKKLLDEHKDLIPVVQPRVDIKSIDDEKVEFLFTIITAPEVKIKKYKGLKVKKDKVEVSNEEIEHELGHLLEKYTEVVTKEDGEVENGDIAVIDFEGFKDGVAFDGGKGENYSLEIGSGIFIPGFEEQLVGMKTGEEKDIQVTFPEDYMAEDLKGKEVTFKVKVNEIKQKQKRELDKDFFDDLGMEGVDTKEKLEKEIKEKISAQKEVEAENSHIDRLLEEIGKNVDVDIPEEMVEEEIDHMMEQFKERLEMQGISLDMYLKFTQSDEKALRDQMEKDAYQRVLYRLMLEEIVKLEHIEVTDEEVEKELDEMAKKYNMEKDELVKMFHDKAMIKYELEMRKTIEMLKEENK